MVKNTSIKSGGRSVCKNSKLFGDVAGPVDVVVDAADDVAGAADVDVDSTDDVAGASDVLAAEGFVTEDYWMQKDSLGIT